MAQHKLDRLVPPRDVQDPAVGNAIAEIYDVLNYILSQFQKFDLENRRTDTGREGQIRVTFDRASKTAIIEAKTDYGWYGIQLQELAK